MEEKENLKSETMAEKQKGIDARSASRPREGGSDLRERQDRRNVETERPATQRRAKPRQRAQKAKPKREKTIFSFKLFGKWDPVEGTDQSLSGYINMDPVILPRSEGAHRGKMHKFKTHIVERLALKMMVSGHTGKKHKLTSGKFGGALDNTLGVIENALDIIEKKEKKNPLEVLIKAIENAAVREEVISYQIGSVVAREAVVTSPQRRIDKTLRYIAQSAYRKSFNTKKKLSEALAEELMSAARGSSDSFAMKEKERLEREAQGAR